MMKGIDALILQLKDMKSYYIYMELRLDLKTYCLWQMKNKGEDGGSLTDFWREIKKESNDPFNGWQIASGIMSRKP